MSEWNFEAAINAVSAAGGSGEFWTPEIQAEADDAVAWLSRHHQKAQLADEMRKAFGYWSLEAWENNMDFQDWRRDWQARYDVIEETK